MFGILRVNNFSFQLLDSLPSITYLIYVLVATQKVLKTNGWNLQCMIKVVKGFSYNQNFVPCQLSALAPLAINKYKIL